MSFEQLLWGLVVAGPLFVVTFLVEGFLRKGYDPMRQPVSALSTGPRGWVQQANFFVNSILLLIGACGLPSALEFYGGSFFGPLLIGIYGAGLLGAGIFTIGAHKKLHDAFSFFVFASLSAATPVFAYLFAIGGEGGWEMYSIVTGVLYVCGFLLFARGFAVPGRLAKVAGLLQRLTISTGALWLSLVALHLLGVL